MYECLWKDGGYGKVLTCPTNHIAHGLCGSGSSADCGWWTGTYNRLKCCRIDATITSDCVPRPSFMPGLSIQCPDGKAVTSACGSGRNRDCPAGPFGNIKIPYRFSCCALGNNHEVTTDCTWAYASWGENLECGRGQVMTGMCGSLRYAACHNRSSHGIRCCKFTRSH